MYLVLYGLKIELDISNCTKLTIVTFYLSLM